MLASLKLFARFWTDKSMCITHNNVHLGYSYLLESVLWGLHETMSSCERLFASARTGESLYVPGTIVHLRYSNPCNSGLVGL